MRLIVVVVVAYLAQRAGAAVPPRQTSPDVPAAVVDAERSWAGADALWPLAKSGDAAAARYAVRAIGRLEDPGNVPGLLALGRQPVPGPAAVAPAVAQSLK
jgi:hypothetical protein